MHEYLIKQYKGYIYWIHNVILNTQCVIKNEQKSSKTTYTDQSIQALGVVKSFKINDKWTNDNSHKQL